MLFTAFEPSGDDHASAVIGELRSRHPDLIINAWGGPKMEGSGATIIEQTGGDAVMGLPGLAKIREHRRINKRIAAWIQENGPTVHIPVDSPAANFPICEIAKKADMRVVHLVAPQIWAWGGWRIRKLRRLTDQVLCLLPFEEEWFRARGVRAEFVGHPLFDRPLDTETLDARVAGFAGANEEGVPRLAVMPGSRPGEIKANFPLQLESFRELRRRHPNLRGLVAATTPKVEERLRATANELGGWPDGLDIVSGQADAVIRWCDLALVVSGTVTLQIARQRKPMVIFYRSNPVMYTLLARWLLSTEFFTLPNLVAGREVVRELVPHFEGHEPITEAVDELISQPKLAEVQAGHLEQIAQQFAGTNASTAAADAIEHVAGLK
ncbi:MAG: hypothetical protein AAGB51_06625 [Planctomycetota bacterium]